MAEQAELRLVSVNVGQPVALDPDKPHKTTGICKKPVSGAVRVGQSGAEGDAVMEKKHHGGPGQALYLYTLDDYAYWANQGVEAGPGVFGDNLTVDGVESGTLCIGDRLEIDAVVLEVTAARIPCATLARRMGDPQFVKRFRQASRPGAYLRVIEGGTIAAGASIELRPFAGDRFSIAEHFAVSFGKRDRATLDRLLALPICERDRADCLEQLQAF